MTLKRSVFNVMASCLVGVAGSMGPRINSAMSERLDEACISEIEIDGLYLKFWHPNERSYSRIRSMFEKEPETIEWIRGFSADDVLWDVGANVGVYTLFAAYGKGNRVLAFEPSPANYHVLVRNLELNGLGGSVMALCLALSDRTQIDWLNMATTEPGGALSSFGETRDYKGTLFEPVFRMPMLGYSIDQFIQDFDPPFPNHLKVDVDGIEHRIVIGAKKLLADRRLRSISIELTEDREDDCQDVIDRLTAAGFSLVRKGHAHVHDTGDFGTTDNYLFSRV